MCGFYSVTSDREYDDSPSALRYFKHPRKLPLDLNKGIDSIKCKPESYFKEKMDSILTYISKNKSDFLQGERKGALLQTTEYVTYRGIISKIMSSPYISNGWCILATKYKNNIYLCQYTKEDVLEASRKETMATKRFEYYGPKFEQYCLSDSPSSYPDTSQQVDGCTQFFGVFKRKLAGRQFLFAGEMDGVLSETPIHLEKDYDFNKLKFIELKVSADPLSSNGLERFARYKCQTVWMQSFLTGVKDIYFGMRDHRGIVKRIDHKSTDDLRRLGQRYWSTEKCLSFLNKFLNLVEKLMEDIDCPNSTYEFNLDPLTQKITWIKHLGKTDLTLLPKWYLDEMNCNF